MESYSNNDDEMNTNELLKLNRKILKKKCKELRVSAEGSKLDMINRINEKRESAQ